MTRPNREICRRCEFKTQRVLVKEWHSVSNQTDEVGDLAVVVAAMLTAPVTQTLPDAWRGPYSVDRARLWIDERDEEGTTLLVLDRLDNQPIGLIFLFATDGPEDSTGTEVRIGFLLAERFWGKGFGAEMLGGLVDWCQEQSGIHSLVGGVDRTNVASLRVLEKCGFRILQHCDDREFYQIRFHR